jgi:hypothetical protein
MGGFSDAKRVCHFTPDFPAWKGALLRDLLHFTKTPRIFLQKKHASPAVSIFSADSSPNIFPVASQMSLLLVPSLSPAPALSHPKQKKKGGDPQKRLQSIIYGKGYRVKGVMV